MSVFSISVYTHSKDCITWLFCGKLEFCPDIDYVDTRHTRMSRASPQTCGTMVLLLPFTTTPEPCIMAADSIIVVYDSECPGKFLRLITRQQENAWLKAKCR